MPSCGNARSITFDKRLANDATDSSDSCLILARSARATFAVAALWYNVLSAEMR